MRHRPVIEPIMYDAVARGTSFTLPFYLSRQNRLTGNITPYNLQGSILFLTVKDKEFDGDSTEKGKTNKDKYREMLRDETSVEGLDDFVFRVTVDCDNPTQGNIPPAWANGANGTKEVFHGMYGEDPKDGMCVFRIPKRMTFVDPGKYYFDIRIMHKAERTIGSLKENPTYILARGSFDIYGTPTNRASNFDIIP